MGWKSMNNPSTAKNITIAVVGIFSVIVLAYVAILINNRSGKTPIELSVFPGDATITIDDSTMKPGTRYLSPGTYIVEAKRDGFEDYSKTLVIEKVKQEVAIILTANSEEALEWAKENDKEYEKVFAKAQEAAAETGKTFNERNPIAKDLPYKTFFYSVGYRMDPNDPSGNSIIIEIDAPEGYRQAAIYRIRQLGYDPTDFTINFREYENPFPL